MQILPEEIKRPFRVVKFLLQNCFVSDEYLFEGKFDEKLCQELYGGKPILSSYYLRTIFLNLLLNIQGTEAQNKLKGGLLALCLFDMLRELEDVCGRMVFGILHHPLIENEAGLTVYYARIEHWDSVLHHFETENTAETVDAFKLLNEKFHDCESNENDWDTDE